ncbi:MAG: diguanylate cyclase, partial [Betaproteobacteria bacterium]|nr:diguanylate cyclase [Betaproteobacteria bacterium]
MAAPLRVLIAEDSEDDALLLVHELRKGGFAPDFERVETAAALEAAVSRGPWDIVITDHNMPGFSSEDALALVRASGLDVPVIIVSGSIGEEVAVAAMRSGAQDYLRKDNLSRLVPAVAREVREAHARQAHRRDKETIRRLSSMDTLTGIANRAALEDRLRNLLHTVRDGATHALLYVDIDQFKVVNDTCGHVAGDKLLQQVARLLHQPLREGDLIARLGGDEFGLLLAHNTEDHARAVADRVLQAVRDLRFTWKDRTFSVGVSIGLAMMPDAGQNLADVLRAADLACYAAKDKGRGRVHVYHAGDSDLQRRHGEMEWVSRLRQAMDENRFDLHFQRIEALHAGTSSPCHCEFLVRLREKTGELIMPGVFIPAAERYGLMPTLDRWIVASALGYLRKRAATGPAALTGPVFLNLSGSTLGDDGF